MDQITATQLLGPLMKYSWDYLILAYALTLMGVAVHWVKKCVQQKLDFVKYWTCNKQSSVLVVLTTTAGYFTTLIVDPNPSLMTFISISYMADSMLNRDGGPKVNQNAREPDEPSY